MSSLLTGDTHHRYCRLLPSVFTAVTFKVNVTSGCGTKRISSRVPSALRSSEVASGVSSAPKRARSRSSRPSLVYISSIRWAPSQAVTIDHRSRRSSEGGTRTVIVSVDDAAGTQLRAGGVLFDTSDVEGQTPISDGTLTTTLAASADPVQPGDLVRVTLTVTNVSMSVTEQDVTVELQLPQGIASIPVAAISGSGTCGASS